MGFSCDGSNTFTGISLDYETDNKLYATFTASQQWDADTEVKVKATIGGETVVKEKFDICEYMSTGTCGAVGDVTLDLSDFLPDGATSAAMTTVITAANIEVEAKPDGSYETCTKGQFLSAHQSFNGGNTSKAVGFAAGTIALAGLAAYVVKKKRSKRSDTEPTLKQNIFGGDMA